MNHFTKWCRSRPAAVKQITPFQSKEEEQEITTMFTLKSDHFAKEGFKSCTILVGDVDLNLMIDLGAKVSIINESLHKKNFLEYPLSIPKQAFLLYDNGRINVLGVVYLPV